MAMLEVRNPGRWAASCRALPGQRDLQKRKQRGPPGTEERREHDVHCDDGSDHPPAVLHDMFDRGLRWLGRAGQRQWPSATVRGKSANPILRR